MPRQTRAAVLAILVLVALSCDDTASPDPEPFTLAVTLSGLGTGTVASEPAGIACDAAGAACEATFDEGTEVTLAATPATGHEFVAWSGGCTGAGACTVTVAANTTVDAAFNDPQMAAQEIGPGGGTLTSADGRLVLEIPAGALAAPETITIAVRAPEELDAAFSSNAALVGDDPLFYDLGPEGLTFAIPARVSLVVPATAEIHDGSGDSLSVKVPSLVLLSLDAGSAAGLDSMGIDLDYTTAGLTLTGLLHHFSPLVAHTYAPPDTEEGDAAFHFTVRNVPSTIEVDKLFTVDAVLDAPWGTDFLPEHVENPTYTDESVPPLVPFSNLSLEPTQDMVYDEAATKYTFSPEYLCAYAGEGEFVAVASIDYFAAEEYLYIAFTGGTVPVRLRVSRTITCTAPPAAPIFLGATGVDPGDISVNVASDDGRVAGRVQNGPAVWEDPAGEPTAPPEDPDNPRQSGFISAASADFSVLAGSYTGETGEPHIAFYNEDGSVSLFDFGPNVRNNTVNGMSPDGTYAVGRWVSDDGESSVYGITYGGAVFEPALPDGATGGRIFDINDAGFAVGSADFPDEGTRAAGWDIPGGGYPFDLPWPGEGTSRLYAVNNDGVAVGYRSDPASGLTVGIVWTGTEWIEIPPDETVAPLLYLRDIADNGTILCSLEDYTGPIVRHTCLAAVGHEPIVLDFFDGANTFPNGISPNGHFVVGLEYDETGSFGPAWVLEITPTVCPFCF
jgi:hypothetical protein